MLAYLARRTLLLAASLLIASAVLFALLRLLPGDAATTLLSLDADAAQVAAVRRDLGVDRPLPDQFALWLGQLSRLDFGRSFVSRLPVGAEIAARLDVTVPLTLLSFGLAVAIAIPAGVRTAARGRSWVLAALTQLGLAVPVFWVG